MHLGEPRRPQRGDRNRAGVVGVVLVGTAGAQQPHPGGQRRRDIDDSLAGADELLGEQVAEAAGRLDRPHPLPIGRSPLAQLLELAARRPDAYPVELLLAGINGYSSVRRLVGVDADHYGHFAPPLLGGWPAAGTPDFGRSVLGPLSSHAAARAGRALQFVTKPTPRRGSRHLESQPTRSSERYELVA